MWLRVDINVVETSSTAKAWVLTSDKELLVPYCGFRDGFQKHAKILGLLALLIIKYLIVVNVLEYPRIIIVNSSSIKNDFKHN